MEKRMTWQEIQHKYPKMFVYLSNVEWDPDHPSLVGSAHVVFASETPNSDYQIRTIQGEFIQEYTAPGTTLQLGALSL